MREREREGLSTGTNTDTDTGTDTDTSLPCKRRWECSWEPLWGARGCCIEQRHHNQQHSVEAVKRNRVRAFTHSDAECVSECSRVARVHCPPCLVQDLTMAGRSLHALQHLARQLDWPAASPSSKHPDKTERSETAIPPPSGTLGT